MAWGTVALSLSRFVYNHGLRDVIEKLIDDPNEKVDELLLSLLDAFLGTKK